MQAIEFIFQHDSKTRLVTDWENLLAEGIPSHAKPGKSCKSPHISFVVAHDIPESVRELATTRLEGLLPFECSLEGLTLFGDDPYVLTYTVTLPSPVITAVLAFREEADTMYEPLRPGWIPHVTLARRIRAAKMPLVAKTLLPAKGSILTVSGFQYCNPDTETYQLIAGEPS